VAGAHGAVLAAILRANPSVRGVLFDMPQIIERAQPVRATEVLVPAANTLLQKHDIAPMSCASDEGPIRGVG
jgi:hypothetical protein